MASIDDCSLEKSCFEEWMITEQLHLSHLQEALTVSPETPNRDAQLSQLIEENIEHFEDYNNKRNALARRDVSAFFAPNWCSSLENSTLWIAGCRPSSYIRLVFALCGLELESRLSEFLEGQRTGNISEISADQLIRVNNLQSNTIQEEEKMTGRMASLQEDLADQPIVMIAKEANQLSEGANGKADEALDEHAAGMLRIMEAADGLRLSTLKEVLSILSPVQGVEFLIVNKRLNLCMHAWGTKRDRMHGRN